MPMRRSPDEGVKPFEVRVSLGGLPALGGMFRSGDPVTIPPHKFHLLVNMRRTPGGMVTRPGLELEFDTGIQECITGLTEDAGDQGGSVILYPGALPRSGPPLFNAATFRAIFPDSSEEYSEFAVAVFGAAAAARGDQSPVVAYQQEVATGPEYLSRPFIFRGQAVQFAMVDRNGTDTVSLLGLNLAERSFLQASDCWRNASGPALEAPSGTPCPGVAGGPLPANASDPPLWPYQHPIGSAGVLVYFDNPFDTVAAWRPDASASPFSVFGAGNLEVVDQILTRQERIDDVLTGTPGVGEVLYFVARRDNSGTDERVLVRWDGAQQTTEYDAIPDDLRVAIGEQAYGPYLASGDLAGGPGDWAAYRKDDSTWQAIGGLGWTLAVGPDVYLTSFFHDRGLSWGGKGQVVSYGEFGFGPATAGDYVHVHEQLETEFDADIDNVTCRPVEDGEKALPPYVFDSVVSGTYCYVLCSRAGGGPLPTGARHLGVGDFSNPSSPVIALGDGMSSLKMSNAKAGFLAGDEPELWIQAIGGRVYVGGEFTDWDPVLQATDGGLSHHGVYDVTNPGEDGSGIFAVYRIAETDQLEDSDGFIEERYSKGALPAVPNDEHGGQGFQAS